MIHFNQICDEEKYAKYIGTQHENNKFYQRLKTRYDIVQVLHFDDIQRNKEFVVLSSHLFYDPTWSDVKVLLHYKQQSTS